MYDQHPHFSFPAKHMLEYSCPFIEIALPLPATLPGCLIMALHNWNHYSKR